MELLSRECCFRTIGKPFEKLIWEVTFACSLKCQYCFQERTGHRDKLSRTQLREVRKHVFRFLSHIRPKHVILSGGEPLVLGNELLEIIKSIKGLGATFSLSTTGFPRKHFASVLAQNPRTINITIDPEGMQGDLYNYRKTKFETLKQTLGQIVDQDISIKGTSLITRENLQNVPKYTQMLRRLFKEIPTLRTLYVSNPYHIGYTRPDLSVPTEEIEEFLTDVNELQGASVDIKCINFSSISMPLQECPAARSVFCIVPNGEVVGCPFLYQRSASFAVGNVVENKPHDLQRALERYSGTISQNVERLLSRTPECNDCPVRARCSGGCFAETFAMKETSIPALLCKRTVTQAIDRNGALTPIQMRIRRKLTTGRPKTKFKKRKIPKKLEDTISAHVRTYMEEAFSDLAHKYDHIECVVRLAKYIARQEGANMRIVVPAAYFHDFAPRHSAAFHFHTDESADAAASFLADNGFDEDEITAITHCIVASSYSSSLLGIEPHTLEAQVVRDADWLEAIGARGIARVFAFGGKYCNEVGKVDFDPKDPELVNHNIMAPDENPVQHFAAKLLKLNKLLLTKTGKRLGRGRHKFMVDFLLCFQKEMDAKG